VAVARRGVTMPPPPKNTLVCRLGTSSASLDRRARCGHVLERRKWCTVGAARIGDVTATTTNMSSSSSLLLITHPPPFLLIPPPPPPPPPSSACRLVSAGRHGVPTTRVGVTGAAGFFLLHAAETGKSRKPGVRRDRQGKQGDAAARAPAVATRHVHGPRKEKAQRPHVSPSQSGTSTVTPGWKWFPLSPPAASGRKLAPRGQQYRPHSKLGDWRVWQTKVNGVSLP